MLSTLLRRRSGSGLACLGSVGALPSARCPPVLVSLRDAFVVAGAPRANASAYSLSRFSSSSRAGAPLPFERGARVGPFVALPGSLSRSMSSRFSRLSSGSDGFSSRGAGRLSSDDLREAEAAANYAPHDANSQGIYLTALLE